MRDILTFLVHLLTLMTAFFLFQNTFLFSFSCFHLLSGTDMLNERYQTREIASDSDISVLFARPEMEKTDKEKLETWQAKIDLGAASRLDMIMDVHNMDKDEAIEKMAEIDQMEMINANQGEG